MELFDTHAHFEGTLDETRAALERAAAAGVTRITAVGGDMALNAGAAAASETARRIGGPLGYLALGWDRGNALAADLPEIDSSLADAVGEIGLDYHYSPETRSAQMSLMARELERARALGLPVVIHTREADDDTLGLLREIPSHGIIHSFTGGPDFCRALLDLGFYISFSGIVTFRAADNVREVAALVPDDRLLVETDSPFLAPVPMRGRTNEPAFVAHTANFLSTFRGVEPSALARVTTANAISIFGETPAATRRGA